MKIQEEIKAAWKYPENVTGTRTDTMKQWMECLVLLFENRLWYVCKHSVSLYLTCSWRCLMFPRLTCSACSRSCLGHPCALRTPFSRPPARLLIDFVTGLSTGFQNPPSCVHRVDCKCLEFTVPVTILRQPLPGDWQLWEYRYLGSLAPGRDCFQVWLCLFPQSFLMWRVSVTSCSSWLDNISVLADSPYWGWVSSSPAPGSLQLPNALCALEP